MNAKGETMNLLKQRAITENMPGFPDGTPGIVYPASGYSDPESIAYEAWMFEPDEEKGEGAYYCSRENWIALTGTHASRCPICGSIKCQSPNCGSRY